jgi:hypothetical protein
MLSKPAGRLLDFASRNSLRLFMAALVLAALFYCVYDLLFIPGYSIADWLINYSDGFVRRGLIGEFILLVAHAAHVPPPWIVVVVQMTIYIAFLLGVYRLAAPLRRSPLWYAMIFSPGGLAFMILADFNAVRKETLAPAALTAVIFLLRRKPPAYILSLAITALFAVMVLSHDSLYCCLPYFFAVVALSTRNLKYAAAVMVLPFIVAALLMNLVRLHHGDLSVAMEICRSVGGQWRGTDDYRSLCSGAIGRLSWTLSRARQEELQNLYFAPLYAVLTLLSLAPYIAALIVLYKRDGLRFDVKVISWIAALCALASSALFYLTIDWGRWIQMQVLCLLLLILMAARHAPSFQPDAKPCRASTPWRKPLLVAVFLYCTCWTLPTLGLQDSRFGYLALPHSLYVELRTVHQVHGWRTIDRGW